MIAYDHAGIRVLLGDALLQLRTISDETVQTVVTSPPYYGLRDYGVDGQIGLESTLDEFIDILVDVFAEVNRVLRPDGTLWLNMGDSYVSAGSGGRDESRWPKQTRNGGSSGATRKTGQGLSAKNLLGVPWRLAFALQSTGWILRQDIIWSKPNPMPESVKDRCTKSHEYLFLLSKSTRYYFDAQAISEPAVTGMGGILESPYSPPGMAPNSGAMHQYNGKHKVPSEWDTGPGGHDTIRHNRHRMGGSKYGDDAAEQHRTKSGRDYNPTGTRNKRSVWTIAPEPTLEAHFATFPEALVQPCILAGSRPSDLVLDPFVGSGTTLHVAHRLERRGIGIELNPEYLPMITGPLSQQVLRLEGVS